MKAVPFILSLFIFCSSSALIAQKSKKKNSKNPQTEQKDKEEKKKPKGPKALKELIKEDAVSQSGLFNTHKVEDKYYFEIPETLLGKEIMVVSRISGYVKNLSFGGAGMKSRPQQVIRWERVDDVLYLRSVSYNSVANENEPIYKSVKNNNFEPIIYSFPIAAYSKDTSDGQILTSVIEINEFFTKDIAMIGALSEGQRKSFSISSVDSKRSMITQTMTFPKNTEVVHVLTYMGKKLPDNFLTQSLSVEMHQSFILLPETLMQPRLYDERVGYFSIQQTNYSSDKQKAAKQRFITRWRLEPKDMEAYKRGELVEPEKQIIYYIDPATPEKWRPYLKQGVNDWQKAFEAAGFKNAIVAKDPPTKEEDPDWSPEDARYSVIRYITTEIANAQGPHVHDPRTGEIIESDILWYHNVMNLLRNWYFVQTAAINPSAQKVQFEDEVMGELIRFVAAHEVGHTLGLPHNMGSSVAYSVDSLRSPTFTSTHGTAPSIMDYARFNYIAQPEDGVTQLGAKIGEYDIWSIIFGYKLIPEATNPEAERKTINQWIKDRSKDPALRFGAQQWSVIDPSSQTEDLGDDAVKASLLGIKNLKRILPKLIEWSYEEAKGFDDLKELYQQIFSQLGRYMGHVSNNIGGVYKYSKTYDEAGAVYSIVPKEKQKAAMQFMQEQLFQTPNWLLDETILNKIEFAGISDRLLKFQTRYLNVMLDNDRMKRLTEAQAKYPEEAYSMIEFMNDLQTGIWDELKDGSKIDPFRRNLQRAYLSSLQKLMKNEKDLSDNKSIVRSLLKKLQLAINDSMKLMKDEMTEIHLEDAKVMIDDILNPKK